MRFLIHTLFLPWPYALSKDSVPSRDNDLNYFKCNVLHRTLFAYLSIRCAQ